jgi:hypothetical protein
VAKGENQQRFSCGIYAYIMMFYLSLFIISVMKKSSFLIIAVVCFLSSFAQRDPRPKDKANIEWRGSYPLYSYVSDEQIAPKTDPRKEFAGVRYYEFWESDNDCKPLKITVRINGLSWEASYEDTITHNKGYLFKDARLNSASTSQSYTDGSSKLFKPKFGSYLECRNYCYGNQMANDKSKNIEWLVDYPLISYSSNTPISSNAEGVFEFWYVTNENATPSKIQIRVTNTFWTAYKENPAFHSWDALITRGNKVAVGAEKIIRYKFASYDECQAWCNTVKKQNQTVTDEKQEQQNELTNRIAHANYAAIKAQLKKYLNKTFEISKIPKPSVIDGDLNNDETKILYKQYFNQYYNGILATLKFISINDSDAEIEIIPNDGNYHRNDNKTVVDFGLIRSAKDIHGIACSDCWLNVNIPLYIFDGGNPLGRVLTEYGRFNQQYQPKFTVKYRTGDINNQVTSYTDPCKLFDEDCYKSLTGTLRNAFLSYKVSELVPNIGDLQYSTPKGDIMIVEEQALITYLGLRRSTEPDVDDATQKKQLINLLLH